MYDLILKGGRIYDGSGMPSFNADIGVQRRTHYRHRPDQ